MEVSCLLVKNLQKFGESKMRVFKYLFLIITNNYYLVNYVWNKNLLFQFTKGTQLSNLDFIIIDKKINPNEEFDICIEMEAPITPGHYISCYRFVNFLGIQFGSQFVVEIFVKTSNKTSKKKICIMKSIKEEEEEDSKSVNLPNSDKQESSLIKEEINDEKNSILNEQVSINEKNSILKEENENYLEGLKTLLEMGFCNRELNQILLNKHQGNIIFVIQELLQM